MMPPALTTSVPTVPDAVEPSPYWICQVESVFTKVELLEGSKMLCFVVVPLVTEEGNSVLQTHRSAEPVSKSRSNF